MPGTLYYPNPHASQRSPRPIMVILLNRQPGGDRTRICWNVRKAAQVAYILRHWTPHGQ
jgi:hypothetical protein